MHENLENHRLLLLPYKGSMTLGVTRGTVESPGSSVGTGERDCRQKFRQAHRHQVKRCLTGQVFSGNPVT